MEACNAVDRELEKVLYKFGAMQDHSQRVSEELVSQIEDLKKEWAETPEDHQCSGAQRVILTQAMNKVRDTISRLASEHRDLHSTVSKVGKAIDRNFIPDFACTSRDDVFCGNDNGHLLNQAICQHFYRQGMWDIGEELAKEVELKIDDQQKEPFRELSFILAALQLHDLKPALHWAKLHRDELHSQNSNLEFMLHRLYFISLVSQGPSKQTEAVNYARETFPHFIQHHEKEIQMLMGTLLYLHQGIGGSPYSHLLDPTQWLEISDAFIRDACSFLGLSSESPLNVCINAGCTALPALLNVKQMMQQRHVTDIWNGKDELPIDIKLGKDYHYHSIFACPILRQPSSDVNPPMKLTCGHVISRDALNKLCNGNKLKCPYCPGEQNPADARQIYF